MHDAHRLLPVLAALLRRLAALPAAATAAAALSDFGEGASDHSSTTIAAERREAERRGTGDVR